MALVKSVAELIDELSVVNIKIFHLVELVQSNVHTTADAKKIQDLNSYRSQLKNALNEFFKDRQEVKL